MHTIFSEAPQPKAPAIPVIIALIPAKPPPTPTAFSNSIFIFKLGDKIASVKQQTVSISSGT